MTVFPGATVVCTALAVLLLIPSVASVAVRLAMRGLGWLLQCRSADRKALLIERAKLEEDSFRKKKEAAGGDSSGDSGGGDGGGGGGSGSAEEEDWEKIEPGLGETAGSSSGSSSAAAALSTPPDERRFVVGFFHPFCNAGGGGERVLWAAIKATQTRWPNALCLVYTGDLDVEKQAMLDKVQSRFDIELHAPTIALVYLSKRKFVQSNMYPHFTLLGQSLGSLVLMFEAMSLVVPDMVIDTMGYAFALGLCHYMFPAVPTGAYVHYPTISTDMLDSLSDRSGQKGLNAGAGAGWKGQLKQRYWQWFAQLYGYVGGTIDAVMCNSSWTRAHLEALWLPRRQKNGVRHPAPAVVFPPVAVKQLELIPLGDEAELTREPMVLYIAQFRPEKNHNLILRAFAHMLADQEKQAAAAGKPLPTQRPRLVLIGSVRRPGPDETHIYQLRLLAHELRVRDHTTFLCDANWPTVSEHLLRASVGVNAMWNEHFGMSVVEYQAAGLIAVVHDSGGPRADIVVDLGEGGTGFRATTEEQFAAAFEAALALPPAERVAMRRRSRASARRFSDEAFAGRWVREMEKMVAAM